jgi:hypothetical protein
MNNRIPFNCCSLFARRFASLFLLASLISACGTTVNVDYDPGTNFAAIKSYNLADTPSKVSDDPRIDSPLVQERIAQALHSALQQKGLRTASPGDIQVRYRIDVKQEIESDPSGVTVGVGTFSRNVGIGFGYGFPADVESYDRMVLTIDLQRPDGTLLWRGSDSRRLDSGSTPEKNTRLINELVQSILETYPPR